MSFIYNDQVSLKNSDAFNRVRTAQPFTLADYSHVYGESPELLTITAGSGTASVPVNKAAIRLTVGTDNGAYCIHQSRMYHHYMPGKSQLILSSFNMGASSSNGAVKRVGYFDDRDGIFFQQDSSGNLHWVRRSYATGVAIDTPVTQSNWNIDPCNGSGPSGFNLDITKTQLLSIDYQWLGVGRIRCGFVHEGTSIIAHEFYHSNNFSTVYWSNPSLPVRCEIRNLSAGSATASLDQICSTVISEGGYESSGIDFSKTTDLRTISVLNTQLPAIAIRLKSTFNGYPNRVTVRPAQIDFLAEDNNIKFEFWRLPGGTVSGTQSIQGGTWVSAGDDSSVEYNITATGWTSNGGNLFNSGFVAGSSTTGGAATKTPSSDVVQNPTSAKRGFISQNYDSTESNIFVLVITALTVTGGSNNFRVGMQWRETR